MSFVFRLFLKLNTFMYKKRMVGQMNPYELHHLVEVSDIQTVLMF